MTAFLLPVAWKWDSSVVRVVQDSEPGSDMGVDKGGGVVLLVWLDTARWSHQHGSDSGEGGYCPLYYFNLVPRVSSKQSVQFSLVTQSCLTLCDPMNRSTPGLPVHHHLPEFTQTHVHWVSDAIQPSHSLSSPSLPASNPSQHQSLFQWVNSLHELAKSTGVSALASLSLFTFMHWRREWQPTPVFLPGESQGRWSLVGCHLWGHTESDMTEAT